MPKVQEKIPEHLRPYLFHGVNLDWRDGGTHATGDCPFCGKEGGKFSIEIDTGLWRCFVCNEGEEKGKPIKGGDAGTFLRKLHEMSYDLTSPAEYEVLAESRRLSVTTLIAWNVCKSILTHDWLLPGYGVDGKLNQLYRYLSDSKSGKMKLLPTPTLGHQLHYHSYDSSKSQVHVCEGPWDGMAWWESLREVKRSGEDYVVTGSESSSLLADVNVLAVPGCETFLEPWMGLLTGKDVTLLYDSDHPREHVGRTIPSAGYSGMSRVASLALSANGQAPASVGYLRWGADGYDPSKPSGYDVRDHLTLDLKPPASRLTRLRELFGLFTVFTPDASNEALGGRNGSVKVGNMGKELTPLKCREYKTLVNAWRKAMKWTDGLDVALSVQLAAILTTKSVGDQLWVKIMSPPSTGKTTIAEGLAVARKFCKTTDTLRGFTSGHRDDQGNTNDLASELDGKALITMDGDTLLQLPNLPNILSEARRLYDGSLNSHFKTGAGKDVGGHRMVWLLQGTGSLRLLDDSELGARFLDCVIMDKIDSDLEDEILMRIANRSESNVGQQVDSSSADSQRDKYLTEAMRLTGGYVEYLRENAGDILSSVVMDYEQKLMCTKYGKFVAFMRARASKKQEEVQEREMAGRLVSQITRLAKGLGGVLNRNEVDTEVMRRTHKVTTDTSRGQSLEFVEVMMRHPEGVEVKTLHIFTGRDESKTRLHLRFLRHLGVVAFHGARLVGGKMSKPVWVLDEKIRQLYSDVMGES